MIVGFGAVGRQAVWLASDPVPGDGEQNNFGDTLSSGVAGPIAGVVILLLGIATVLLIWNMNSRLRRLPKSFEQAHKPTPPLAEHPEERRDSSRD